MKLIEGERLQLEQIGDTYRLILRRVRLQDHGKYYCRASNILAKETSGPIVLTGAPSIPLLVGDLRSSQVMRFTYCCSAAVLQSGVFRSTATACSGQSSPDIQSASTRSSTGRSETLHDGIFDAIIFFREIFFQPIEKYFQSTGNIVVSWQARGFKVYVGLAVVDDIKILGHFSLSGWLRLFLCVFYVRGLPFSAYAKFLGF